MTQTNGEPHDVAAETDTARPDIGHVADHGQKRSLSSAKKSKKQKKQGPVRDDQCTFFMDHKQRMCSMQRKKGHVYCSEHMVKENASNSRVPCPLDPKHSVWAKDLDSHVKKCNAKPCDTQVPWYKKNANTYLTGYTELGDTEISEIPRESKSISYEWLFSILDSFQKATAPPPKHTLNHHGLDSWLDAKANQKHIIQQSSLIGNLQKADLLSIENYYVEFGCGKAELSRAINKCIAHDSDSANKDCANKDCANKDCANNDCANKDCANKDSTNKDSTNKDSANKTSTNKDSTNKDSTNKISTNKISTNKISTNKISTNYGFGLIDRGVNRMKMDYKIRTETQLKPHVKRCRIDIEHLDLDGFLESEPHNSWVGVSKHLCGVATDLTLKSILNSNSAKSKVRGLVVAMCCRHVCDYKQLLPASRDFLYGHGIQNEADFALIKKVVSWAVCGRRDGAEATHETGLGYSDRERYGFLARSLIDFSRVHGVEVHMPEYSAQLVLYAEQDTTLENHCLIVQRR